MNIVLPFRGEFGIKVRYHVPAVAALPRPLKVYIEYGEEALYPDAEHLVIESPYDDYRRDLYRNDEKFVQDVHLMTLERYPGCKIIAPDRSKKWPEKRFIPKPTIMYENVPSSDVIVCPRVRNHGAQKNWTYWPLLVDMLGMNKYKVLAAGMKETSDTRVLCPGTWMFPRVLDATIQAMLLSKLVIATDAGLAHLAVLCGVPLLLIGYNGGLVAPGPVQHHDGTIVRDAYWTIRLQEYYRAANHTGSRIDVVPNGWENPEQVLQRAREILK